MRDRLISAAHLFSNPKVSLGGAAVLGVLIVSLAWYASSASPAGATVRVSSGPITEEVDVTGTVKAAHSTDLAFQTSGRVASIGVQVGDHVQAGQTLVALDGSQQAAAVALAQANLEAQQAKLASLTSGTRSEQLAIDQTAVAQAEGALANALSSAYTNADDAVHAKADQVFTNPRNAQAKLTILVPDSTLAQKIENERVALEPMFSAWAKALSSVSDNPQGLIPSSTDNLQSVAAFLDDLTAALSETQPSGSITAATLSGYQTAVNAGRLSVLGAQSSLTSATTGYKSAVGALTLAQAGATANDIAAQKAAVDAAQASLASAQAASRQTVIFAPVDGTVTAQNANLGQTVVPGVPLVSMIADGKYQATAEVSEADITKISRNDEVNVTFGSSPNAVFKAVVTTVDPAAHIVNGVSSYGVTVTFLENDPRLLPGLSANIHIITQTKPSALLVPTSAIITDGTQKFVYVKNTPTPVRTPVTTGIQSAAGMTEILSGLSEGDTVLAFGSSVH